MSSNECRIPFYKAPFAHRTADDEGILLNKLFGRFARAEDCHRAFGRITERAGRMQESARMKLIESGAVRGKMSRQFWRRIRSYLVKANYLHKSYLSPLSTMHSEPLRRLKHTISPAYR